MVVVHMMHTWCQVGMMAPSFLISDPRQPGFPIVFVSPGFTLLPTAVTKIAKNPQDLQRKRMDESKDLDLKAKRKEEVIRLFD